MPDRQVFEGPDGAYLESEPGAGPRHPDDIPASSATMEAKALQSGVTPEQVIGDPRGVEVVAYGVIDAQGERRGGFLAVYGPGNLPRADEHARNVSGLVVAMPVIADHR